MKKNALKKYFLSLPKPLRRRAVQKIAEYLKISEWYVYAMANGRRKIQFKYVVGIEKVTKKSILRQELCPDLYN